MNTNTIDTEKTTTRNLALRSQRPSAPPPRKRSPRRRPAGPRKPASKPKADRANKKTEVIALMKRAKGATLAEIMATTKWQAHTVRGFVSILGSKGGEKIDSSKNAAGERTYKIGK